MRNLIITPIIIGFIFSGPIITFSRQNGNNDFTNTEKPINPIFIPFLHCSAKYTKHLYSPLHGKISL